jgi:hypothetical protein
LLGHCQEGLLDISGILRRRFEEWDGELIREFLNTITKSVKSRLWDKLERRDLGDTVLHDFLTGQIRLITHKQLVNPL